MKFIIIPVKYKSDETFKLEKEAEDLKNMGIDKEVPYEEINKTAIYIEHRINLELIILYNKNSKGDTYIDLVNGPIITSLSEEDLDNLITLAIGGYNAFTSYKLLEKNELSSNK